jgi:Ni/Co efflux regulator RcnB
MKKILTAAIALSVLASAGAASAQSYQGRPHQGGYQGQGGYQQGYDRRDERRDDRRDDRRDERRGDRYDRAESRYERRAERRYNAGRYHAPRGYQARQWRRGEHLPPQYRSNAYYVDYRAYRLAPPPYGYRYVRVDNDVVLTAIASGVIASIVFNLFD